MPGAQKVRRQLPAVIWGIPENLRGLRPTVSHHWRNRMMRNIPARHSAIPFAVVVIVFTAGATVAPVDTYAAKSVQSAENPSPQQATVDDVRLFDRYIGKFRSQWSKFDDGTTEYFNTVAYEWFDHEKTIVKFTVATVIPSMDRVIVTAEGFYGYDPFNKRLYVFGAFTNGTTGWGSIGEFNRDTGTRAVWAQSMDANGIVTYVRDEFQPIDADSWKNKTSIRQGDEGDWDVVYEETFTREQS